MNIKSVVHISFLMLAFFQSFGQKNTLVIADSAVFYDGYAAKVSFPTSENTQRLRNDLLTTKLNNQQISQLQHMRAMTVEITARCDNYDRIGNVFIAMVPKGVTSYITDSVTKIEIGRFITPFMNKNKDPKTVSYSFDCSVFASLFSDNNLLQKFDFWIEYGVFGVPYAAQKQVTGCSERNDVFQLKLAFTCDNKSPKAMNIFPIVAYQMVNNYEVAATDTVGKTTKSYSIDLPFSIENATLFIISSNHGANEGGEEYIRRKHFIYCDSKKVFEYTPGGKSCEPFRIHNTQGNGIYGKTVETDSSWASWNNWCPGDVIPNRTVQLGNLEKGTHTFFFTVPDAQFVDKTGYFPLSLVLYSPKKRKTK